LFLDEIGNLSIQLQRKLLRVLEERTVTPLGSDQSKSVDVRLICATNRPIAVMSRSGEFREDLLYRINTIEVVIPPLRERTEDIAALVAHFVDVYARKYGLTAKQVTPGALKRLEAHSWPGNVRELRHAVERALIMSDAPVLDAQDFFFSAGSAGATDELDLDELKLDSIEHQVIRRVLAKHAGNVSRAAREHGITRASLYRRMEKYGL
jgi:transcriptional regulator with PAS, ATPase and Fis domain